MKYLGKFILLIIIVSCSNKGITLDEYANYPVKFAKHQITHPSNDFSVFTPINWKWNSDGYGSEEIILGINVNSKLNEDSNQIVIQKIRGHKKDLKSEFEYSLDILENNLRDRAILESGMTNILDKEAYFVHTELNSEIYGKDEKIVLIVESNTKGEFYHLAAIAPKTDSIKNNMAVLIKCLMTFEMLNN